MRFTISLRLYILIFTVISCFMLILKLNIDDNKEISFYNSKYRNIEANKILTSSLLDYCKDLKTFYQVIYKGRNAGKVDDDYIKSLDKIKKDYVYFLEQFVVKGTKYADRDRVKQASQTSQEVVKLITKDLIHLVEEKADESAFRKLDKVLIEKMGFVEKIANELDVGVQKALDKNADAILEVINRSDKNAQVIITSSSVLMFLLMSLIIFSITRRLRRIKSNIGDLSNGNYAIKISDTHKKDELGDLSRDIVRLRESVEKSVRLQCVTDNLSTSVMMCDADLNITYLNQKAMQTLGDMQHALEINVAGIVGSSVDLFHKKAQNGEKIIPNIYALPHTSLLEINGFWISANAHAMPSHDGSFQGSFIDFEDVTEKTKNIQAAKDAEKEINILIQAALKGDLEKRMDSSHLTGFYKELSDGMNHLFEAIVDPISHAIKMLIALSEGQLKQNVDHQYEGSFGSMFNALTSTIGRLQTLVGQIINASNSITDSASHIANQSDVFSSRIELQATNMQKISTEINQISGAIQANSRKTVEVSNFSKKTNEVAQKGGEIMEVAIGNISNIKAFSQKISDIVQLIDEIAFQTNLLSLNAAVEATRAGDAGKGFAVVASEVQILAGRSAEASNEIRKLVSRSVQQVDDGVSSTNDAYEQIKSIIDYIGKVTVLVDEIAHASSEQSSGILSVTTSIGEMDEMTQKNATIAVQNLEESKIMLKEAKRLHDQVKFFRI